MRDQSGAVISDRVAAVILAPGPVLGTQDRGGAAPKALNFSGNLIGFRERATIDVWAARLLQRLAGKLRIPSMAEGSVSGKMLSTGETTLTFGFGQDVFQKAVKEIRADKEMKGDKLLASINDDDLQAIVWFLEKEVWTKNNWTTAAGEGGSFEYEAELAGQRDHFSTQQYFILGDNLWVPLSGARLPQCPAGATFRYIQRIDHALDRLPPSVRAD